MMALRKPVRGSPEHGVHARGRRLQETAGLSNAERQVPVHALTRMPGWSPWSPVGQESNWTVGVRWRHNSNGGILGDPDWNTGTDVVLLELGYRL